MLCWGLVHARRDYISQTDIKPVYYYSILATHIMGIHRRHTTPKVVQNIELNWCESRAEAIKFGGSKIHPLKTYFPNTCNLPRILPAASNGSLFIPP